MRQFWVIIKNAGIASQDTGNPKYDVFKEFHNYTGIPISLAFWNNNNNIDDGIYFGEEYPYGNKEINYYLTLAPDASAGDISEVLALLWQHGAGAPSQNGSVDVIAIQEKLPNTAAFTDYTTGMSNKDQEGQEGYKSLFDVIHLDWAPKWVNDFLNAITGKSKLSMWIWIAVAGYSGFNLTDKNNSKTRTVIFSAAFLAALYMTYDSIQYQNQKSKFDGKEEAA